MHNLPNPFIAGVKPELSNNDMGSRFVLDETAFMRAIEEKPKFLSDPSPEYLQAIADIHELMGKT